MLSFHGKPEATGSGRDRYLGKDFRTVHRGSNRNSATY